MLVPGRAWAPAGSASQPVAGAGGARRLLRPADPSCVMHRAAPARLPARLPVLPARLTVMFSSLLIESCQ